MEEQMPLGEKGMMEERKQHAKGKGGLKTIPFIIANETFEKLANTGLTANMIQYLTRMYHITGATGTIVLFLWGALSNFVPIFGGFLADSYLGRFRVIALGSMISLVGMIVLWLTAMLPGARPQPCDPSHHNCEPAKSWQLAVLFSAFALMSIGSGGIRPCSLAFGAHQIEKKDDPKNERRLQAFFNFYYASVAIAMVIAGAVIVYIQEKKGYAIGYGIPVVLMTLSAILFLAGSSLYIKRKANNSVFVGLAQVIAVSVKNRKLNFPQENAEGRYLHNKGSKVRVPSDKLRFLNKACIIRNPTTDLAIDGAAADPWTLCTVQQVEELKSVIRVLPLWSTGIMSAVVISQHTFPVLQARTMDRHIGSSHFEIPAASVSLFSILTLIVWIAIYVRLVVPFLSKFTGRPRGLSLKTRMGIGLVFSCMASAVAAVVESIRRKAAIEQGLENDVLGVVHMSAMYLVPQFCFTGLSEAFNVVGQIEFFYSEIPKSMASIAVALFSLGMGVGNLLGGLITKVIKETTGGEGRAHWVVDNLNKGHLDYYYWVITALSLVNLVYFLVCSWAYGEEGKNRVSTVDEEEAEMEVRELQSRSGEQSAMS